MTYRELREYMQELEKFQGCEKRARAPLIHEGFPGTFNLSFTEYDWMNDYGGFSNFHKDTIVSTIQSCIRPRDINENLRSDKGLWKYLGVFEMADLAGQVVLSGRNKVDEYHLKQIKRLVTTLTDLGLEKGRIFPTYNAGGNITEITKGKYNFDFRVPEDVLSIGGFVKAGIPQMNLIPDKTRDTFLSLHINQKTPWGYRNEINYNIGTQENPILLDVGTLERCLWFPQYSGEEKAGNIMGLTKIPHTISVSGLGLERLCMTVNGLSEVKEVDYIQKFYDAFREKTPELSEEQRYKAGEVIRALHRVYSDCASYGIKLSVHRDRKARQFLQVLKDNAGENLDEANLNYLLKINAEAQPWHDNLQAGIGPTKQRILGYLESRKNE